MGKLLLISDLKSSQLLLIEKALKLVETSIEEIILHYAYQIPANTNNVIESHDKIKLDANNKLYSYAEEINNKTGIKTSIKLSLGSNKNTLKRALLSSNFDYVLTNNNLKVDGFLKKEFPKIIFLENIA